jgi:hypothetical protein
MTDDAKQEREAIAAQVKVWPSEQLDAMVRAFDENSEKHGLRETLMAVVSTANRFENTCQPQTDALKIARADVIEIVGEATTKLRIANIDKHECKDAVWAAYDQAAVDCYNEILAALEARGLEIREKGQ